MAQTKSPISKQQTKGKKGTKRLPNAQHPIEIEYWYVLPTIRREIATSLKKRGNLRQKEVADILGITEAAVSQYIKGTRGVLELENGDLMIIPDWLLNQISKSTDKILKSQSDNHNTFLKEINRLMTIIRENPRDFLCEVHSVFGYVPNIESCDICIEIV